MMKTNISVHPTTYEIFELGHKKFKKLSSKVAQKYILTCPELPNRIDQLYIKLRHCCYQKDVDKIRPGNNQYPKNCVSQLLLKKKPT